LVKLGKFHSYKKPVIIICGINFKIKD